MNRLVFRCALGLLAVTGCGGDDAPQTTGGTGGNGSTTDPSGAPPVTVSATTPTAADSSGSASGTTGGPGSSDTGGSTESAGDSTGASTGGSTGDSTGGGAELTADPEVIAHGGTVVISGTGLTGATEVTVEGVAIGDFVVDSDTQITADVVDAVPTGVDVELAVVTEAGTQTGTVTAIHLVINEVDPDSPNDITADGEEFIELATGVDAPVSLEGYTVVLWSGMLESYVVVGLEEDGVTSAEGLLVIGSSNVDPDIAFGAEANNIQNGEDAVAIYQGVAADFAGATLDEVGTEGLIDAVVYESNADPDVSELYPLMSCCGRFPVIEEGLTAEIRETVSIVRCADDRRSTDAFVTNPMTPGAANDCD